MGQKGGLFISLPHSESWIYTTDMTGLFGWIEISPDSDSGFLLRQEPYDVAHVTRKGIVTAHDPRAEQKQKIAEAEALRKC
jgi:hypothetical protein